MAGGAVWGDGEPGVGKGDLGGARQHHTCGLGEETLFNISLSRISDSLEPVRKSGGFLLPLLLPSECLVTCILFLVKKYHKSGNQRIVADHATHNLILTWSSAV